MKKKIKHPDGSEVEYEGTVEEILELEKKIDVKGIIKKEESSSGKKLLTEEDYIDEKHKRHYLV